MQRSFSSRHSNSYIERYFYQNLLVKISYFCHLFKQNLKKTLGFAKGITPFAEGLRAKPPNWNNVLFHGEFAKQ